MMSVKKKFSREERPERDSSWETRSTSLDFMKLRGLTREADTVTSGEGLLNLFSVAEVTTSCGQSQEEDGEE